MLRPLLESTLIVGASSLGAYAGSGRSPGHAALAAAGAAAGASALAERDFSAIIDGMVVSAAGAAGAYIGGGRSRKQSAVGAAIGTAVALLLNGARRAFGAGAGAADTPPCAIRIDKNGITVDGRSVDDGAEAARACGSPVARILATGDAKFGQYTDVQNALSALGIKVRLDAANLTTRPS